MEQHWWLNHGADISNSRSAMDPKISPRTVSNLRLRWKFFTGSDVSATPALANGVVYFPSWNGILYAINAFTGDLCWKQNLTELTGLQGSGVPFNFTFSRSTPTIAGNLLIVPISGPAVVIAVTRLSGSLVWLTKLDSRPLARITMSGTVYMGLARLEIRTGAIEWQTYTLPDNGGKLGGYAGGAIWGSSPAIDPTRKLVYVATGNLYTAPPNVTECQERQNNQTTRPTNPDQCIGPDVNFNSIIAFELGSGRIRWASQLGGYDIWYFACLVPNNPDCPPGPNIDADFGEAPMMLSILHNGTRRDVAVAVQKSGFAWAVDRDNGDIVWSKLAGPGGVEGGGQWGAANDGKRIYTNIANSEGKTFKLAPSNQTTTVGGWVALDANSGEILWSIANPSNDTAQAPVSVVNGVVFAGSVAPNGPIYAINASNGNILWSYDTGATVYGGISASYGCIYLGNGYLVFSGLHPTWNAGAFLYAFCLW
ncbi:hypothetical protein CRG98_042806 [Punica granatum]|uniref:Pyrrolo-quinoline quinone repeat domain-containing protein n=1 Tax=Punica granatum TaxID=22663 RepID=A0A2I0HYT6_PUNGR|nr:hypothetical protein CRG98_042806 [Punica granatum]